MKCDQTEPEWLLPPNDKIGTGIFLYELKNKYYKKGWIRDVSYEECKESCETASVLKWVPHNIASLEELIKSCR